MEPKTDIGAIITYKPLVSERTALALPPIRPLTGTHSCPQPHKTIVIICTITRNGSLPRHLQKVRQHRLDLPEHRETQPVHVPRTVRFSRLELNGVFDPSGF